MNMDGKHQKRKVINTTNILKFIICTMLGIFLVLIPCAFKMVLIQYCFII